MNIHQKFIQDVGNPLEWNSAQKASLLLWMYLFDQVLYQLFIELGMRVPQFIPYLDQEYAAVQRLYFQALILVTVGLLVALHFIQNKFRESVVYEYIACMYFGVTHVYYAYNIGLMSLPVGVVLVGAPVVGFIFVHRMAVAAAFIASLLLIIVLSMASMFWGLEYAPLAVSLHDANGQLDPVWVVSYVVFSLPHLAFIFCLTFYVLQRWRSREQEVLALSRTDGLTGLMNRSHVVKMFEQEKQACESTKVPLAVIMIDLDHFKSINDRWGHDVGDRVLIAASNTLKQSVRQGDHVGRYGGEEFLVILPGLNQDQASSLAERIRQQIAAIEVEVEGVKLSVSASLGMACYSGYPFVSIENLIKRADVALYQAKDGGRDQLVVAVA